jgi:uncharacterized protein DUF1996
MTACRLVLSASLGACCVLLVSTAAPAEGRVKLHGNNFFSNCRFSHTGANDPIVLPNQPGRSHPHTFFGNTTTNASSTLASLRSGGTTCRPPADKAAYWVPTLFQAGREVRPAKAQVYYVLRGYEQMHAFPPGLRIVAGNAHAVRPQSARVAYWACGATAVRIRISSTAPKCGVVRTRFKGLAQRCAGCPIESGFEIRVKTIVELHVNFPDCWDGRRLDSADHHSHMTYSRNYVCPDSYPVKVPLIRLLIRYPITDGHDVVLASGGQLTGHADFFNAWDVASGPPKSWPSAARSIAKFTACLRRGLCANNGRAVFKA